MSQFPDRCFLTAAVSQASASWEERHTVVSSIIHTPGVKINPQKVNKHVLSQSKGKILKTKMNDMTYAYE